MIFCFKEKKKQNVEKCFEVFKEMDFFTRLEEQLHTPFIAVRPYP